MPFQRKARMLSLSYWLIFGCVLLQAATAVASTAVAPRVLRVYGPGGPHHVLQECAALYEEQQGQKVLVIKAMPQELAQRLPADGDLYYGGAEYMLEEFLLENPGVLDLATAVKLHPRRIGILVREGNPHDIQGPADLSRAGIDLLAVRLEKMRSFHGTRADAVDNIRRFEYTGQQGMAAWLEVPELDAWVTYRSWHVALKDDSHFIEIPGDQALRYIPMALTERTPQREEALEFIRFLQSAAARRVFEEHGWD